MTARRAHAYPQVDPGAAGLVDTAVAVAPAGATARRALAIARKRDAAIVALGDRHVLRDDLAHAVALGLDDLAAGALARAFPGVSARASEIVVRRHIANGAAFVLVKDDGPSIGAIGRRATIDEGDGTGISVAGRMVAALPSAMLDLLTTIGHLAAARHARAFLVGGIVRDALRGLTVSGRDVDVVVEGDGLGVARDLAGRRGARLVVHERFLTASVESGTSAPGEIGRVDIATARAERYEARGALPRVRPADILADLRRRDFTVNAMAVELQSGDFGLLDPLGGRGDLAARRLRVLHPLSFVDDPTRIFRAARYAQRLGLRLDAGTLAAQRLALRLAPYPRLSGQRITAELDRIVSEPDGAAALERLGAGQAFRLLDPRYRFAARTATRVRALAGALAWSREHGLEVCPLELVVVTLLADQAPDVAATARRRLAFSGERLARLAQAHSAPREAAAALGAAHVPSARAGHLRRLSPLDLAWLMMAGEARVRAALEWYVRHGRALTPALRGADVIALGIPRGPAVARTLAALTAAKLDGALPDAEAERAFVRTLVQGDGAGAAARGTEGQRSTGEEGQA